MAKKREEDLRIFIERRPGVVRKKIMMSIPAILIFTVISAIVFNWTAAYSVAVGGAVGIAFGVIFYAEIKHDDYRLAKRFLPYSLMFLGALHLLTGLIILVATRMLFGTKADYYLFMGLVLLLPGIYLLKHVNKYIK